MLFFQSLVRMTGMRLKAILTICLSGLVLALSSCGKKPDEGVLADDEEPAIATEGTIEVTAELLEIPQRAIFRGGSTDYATVLKYRVVKVHRGDVPGETLYVAHYNPWKPRSEAADQRVPGIGGNLRQFQAGQRHHMALEVPIDDHFRGGIVNRYFAQATNLIHWAVWTNLEDRAGPQIAR
jgi:hypothetical protein